MAAKRKSKPKSKPKKKPAKRRVSAKARKAALAKAERAADAIRDAFARTSEALESGKTGPSWFKDLVTTYEVRRYVDNAVDGVLRLSDLPEHERISDVLLEIEEAGVIAKPRRFKVWFSMAFTGDFEKPDIKRGRAKAKRAGVEPPTVSPADAAPAIGRYNRYKGSEVTELHSQRLDRLAEHLLAARRVADNLENKAKIPDSILIRFYWSPEVKKRPKPKKGKTK